MRMNLIIDCKTRLMLCCLDEWVLLCPYGNDTYYEINVTSHISRQIVRRAAEPPFLVRPLVIGESIVMIRDFADGNSIQRLG